MYLEDSNKKLKTYKEFEELNNLVNDDTTNFNIGVRFFKCLIVSFLENISQTGDYKYSISEEEINKIANNLMNNNVVWEVIDEHISQELMNYEK